MGWRAEIGAGHPTSDIYDVAANEGWVSIGIDRDTAAFALALESIRRSWRRIGVFLVAIQEPRAANGFIVLW